MENSKNYTYKTKSVGNLVGIYVYDEVTSTNDIIKEGDYKPFDVVIAKKQTKGRGRGGNTFVSESGGLYMSMLVPSGDNADYITPLAGCAVARVLIDFGLEPKIKWVNDVFVGGKKICGILAEKIERDGIAYIVLGIGLNVNNVNFGEFSHIATSMKNEKATVYKNSEVAAALIDALAVLLKKGIKREIIDFYREHSCVIGKRITVSGRTEEVTAEGIDADGRLIIRTDRGESKTISSGSISVCGGYV